MANSAGLLFAGLVPGRPGDERFHGGYHLARYRGGNRDESGALMTRNVQLQRVVAPVLGSLVVILATLASSGPLAAAATSASPATKSAQAPPKYAWPEVHQNPTLQGVSNDPSIGTSNAAQLGVRWMYGSNSQSFSSPVVAWNAALGETVVYATNQAGYLVALNEANGEPVWSEKFGSPIESSPLAEGNYVWVAPSLGARLYKLDAATGAIECSATLSKETALLVQSSPTIADPPGGVLSVYIGVDDGGPYNGPVDAVNESNCALEWQTTPEPVAGTGGNWSFMAYAVDATGQPLVLFGTADPDSAIYAVNALTGDLVWRYATYNPPPSTYDDASGVVTTAPGVNGFPDGMAYEQSKWGTMYALNMTSGKVVWQYNYDQKHGITVPDSFATAALLGKQMVYGDFGGLSSVNAKTGGLIWRYNAQHGGFDSSPLIVGPAGQRVVVDCDLDGGMDVFSLKTGALLYRYQTGSTITASPAETDGNVVFGSGDGYIYDFAVGGGSDEAPTTVVTSPTTGETVPNPDGSLTITGTASAAQPISGVNVNVQLDGADGQWWDGATSSWVDAPYPNPATLTASGTDATSWTLSVPVPTGGGGLLVEASAVGANGVADISAEQSQATTARSTFTVSPSATAPVLTTSASYAAPGAAITVSGTGFLNGEQVSLGLNGTSVRTMTANGSGDLASTTVTVPDGSPFGPDTLTATGETSGLTTSTPLYVTNDWDQYHQNAEKWGNDPDDDVFSQHVAVGNDYMSQAWNFNAGAPIDGSPAVMNAVAYVATTDGVVDAIDMQTGMQVWTVNLPDGETVDSTPAVTTNGIVIVGTSSGDLVGLSATDGSTVWTTSLGTSDIESSPTLSGSDVYVGTDGGQVVALDATTGAVVWSADLSGEILSSPAIDTTANLLVVGSTDDDVYALNLGTGASVWTYTTGGAVDGTPLIYEGQVFIGSADGNAYSLDETTGAETWAVATGGPIVASPAIRVGTEQAVSFGSSTGEWDMNPTGSPDPFQAISNTSPITGMSAAGSMVVANFADGWVLGSKSFSTVNLAWLKEMPTTLDSTPVLINGEAIITGQDGSVTCFTVPGQPPV